MSQHDYIIDNGTGSAVRADINSALTAIAGANSGANAPSTTYAYQLWADTTSGNLKIRNGGNSAWIEVGALASANLGLMLATRFPNVNANVTASDEELNKLDGVTATTTELNLLAGATQLGVVMTAIYPIGCVFTSVVSTNPATLLAGMSGTTWVSFGSGRTLVGLDSGDADFNSVEETGGAKTDSTTVSSTSLTESQIPSHRHETIHGHASGSSRPNSFSGISGNVGGSNFGGGTTDDAWGTSYSKNTGGGSGHNHTNTNSTVQPYIVVYFWKRTG
tara:strand:- start:1458 stop:2288 length:831 start_codon:yes stop_codon:yes gene_type:complete